MEEIPRTLIVSYLEVVVMPNGEVISAGNPIGWFRNLKKYLHKETNK